MSKAKVYATKDFTFEAAHYLTGYEGECANVHGHSYKLSVQVSGEVHVGELVVASACMVMDFKELKKLVKEVVLSTHDHAHLNTLYYNPTAEVMAVEIFNSLKDVLPEGVTLESVKLWETQTSFVEYRGE